VEEVGPGVEVLARVAAGGSAGSPGRIVAVRQGRVMATSFHPEISGDDRIHRSFVGLVTA
jgi:5'-phosphate synthase pdxT subunit